ncbi:hypothetical protein F0919_02545 [Taibaiella lutea]|uniref:Uncharacterized protein n=1 Tax=Taibaiella lutea TaxID=2608001 RepID=A0A5M6CND0_9BACT|nr:hypothetical protein [Taibaiella lutea]KAA5536567.1 hypothetical protein F0919_02545 [Taibaiella lutea]
MRNRNLCYLLLGVSLLVCCSFFAIGQEKTKALYCSEKSGNYSIQWNWIDKPQSIKFPAKSGNLKLPKKYIVFEVVSSNLNSNLTLLRKNGGTITLPFIDSARGVLDCLTFKVVNSGTLSKELNDKYPEIVSLKGFDVKNKYNTVRFDYDGTSMNISVICNGINYLYAPYKVKNKVYYLLFKKTDNNGSSRLTR